MKNYCEKGHFYYVEKRFETLKGLRDKMERTAKSLDLEKTCLKKCMSKVQDNSKNYLWVVIGKKSYVFEDVTMGNHSSEAYEKTLKVLGIADYIFNVTTWKCDGYRFRELPKQSFERKVA